VGLRNISGKVVFSALEALLGWAKRKTGGAGKKEKVLLALSGRSKDRETRGGGGWVIVARPNRSVKTEKVAQDREERGTGTVTSEREFLERRLSDPGGDRIGDVKK